MAADFGHMVAQVERMHEDFQEPVDLVTGPEGGEACGGADGTTALPRDAGHGQAALGAVLLRSGCRQAGGADRG